jgi:hypothetical protein
MENDYRRFTRLLVSLPPIQEVIDEVTKKVEKAFNRCDFLPEYVKTPDIEGFAISWPTWYGYDYLNAGESARLRSFFDMHFVELTNVDITESLIEYVDKDNWWYLSNPKEISDEVFRIRYRKGEESICVYKDFLRFNLNGVVTDIGYSELTPDYIDLGPLKDLKEPLLRICRRGFFNNTGAKYLKYLYRAIGLTKIPRP